MERASIAQLDSSNQQRHWILANLATNLRLKVLFKVRTLPSLPTRVFAGRENTGIIHLRQTSLVNAEPVQAEPFVTRPGLSLQSSLSMKVSGGAMSTRATPFNATMKNLVRKRGRIRRQQHRCRPGIIALGPIVNVQRDIPARFVTFVSRATLRTS